MQKKIFTKENWKIICPLLILLILMLSVAIILVKKKNLESGNIKRIIFTSSDKDRNLYIIGGRNDILDPIYLGRVTGTPDWSPNGEFIAIGCEDANKICIIDSKNLPSPLGYPSPIRATLQPYKIIDLPSDCQNSVSNEVVSSISWSYDSERLALVCGLGWGKPTFLCTITLNGKNNCWSIPEVQNLLRVNWSPNSEELLLSEYADEKAMIYLYDITRKAIKPIANGWSPDWSNDGDQFIFFCNMNLYVDPRKYPDICISDKDGKNRRVIYENPYPTQTDNENYYYTTFSCSETSQACRLSWSSDEKQIIFDGNIGPNTSYTKIMKLIVDTGEISVLFGTGKNSDPVFQP